MNNRKELIEEQVLRENIRKAIKLVRENKSKTAAKEEEVLRSVIRKMLSEGTAVGDDAPHEKTGINYLRTTLKKIIPSIKDAYMSLTTDEEPRENLTLLTLSMVSITFLRQSRSMQRRQRLSGDNDALTKAT